MTFFPDKVCRLFVKGGGRGYLQIGAPPTPHPHEEESANQRIAFFSDSKLRAGHVEKESSLQIHHHRHNYYWMWFTIIKGGMLSKKAPFVEYCIWIVFSESQGRAGEKWGKPCHSLTFCKGICDMCHENAKIFRYMFSSIRKPQTIRIIIGQTGSMGGERGGGLGV